MLRTIFTVTHWFLVPCSKGGAIDQITCFKQRSCQIGAILSGDSSNDCDIRTHSYLSRALKKPYDLISNDQYLLRK